MKELGCGEFEGGGGCQGEGGLSESEVSVGEFGTLYFKRTFFSISTGYLRDYGRIGSIEALRCILEGSTL